MATNNTERILRKLDLYRKDPDIVQPLSNTDLADLVVVVLSQVRLIEDAIAKGRLDGYTPQPDKDYLSKESALKLLNTEVNRLMKEVKDSVAQKNSELDTRVLESLQRLQDGKDGRDGVITDAEIERAATVALGMIELPDFDSLIAERTTANPEAIRNALELLSDDNKLSIEALKGLDEIVNQLREANSHTYQEVQRIGGANRNYVKKVAWINGSSTQNNVITVSETEPENPSLNDIWIQIV